MTETILMTTSQLSRVFSIDVRRIGRVLARMEPAGYRGARAVYDLGEAGWLLMADKHGVDLVETDPDRLPPRERLNHYQAERERVKLAGDAAQLLPMNDYRVVTKLAVDAMTPILSRLADDLAATLNPEAAALARRNVANALDRLQENLEL